jgi:prepilin-type processing-associated H-X9-DG protein
MEIRDISPSDIQIRRIDIPDLSRQTYTGLPIPSDPPITVNIGFPIVDIPGCVEARDTQDLQQIDPRGNVVFCDGNVPSYNPLNFEPNRMLPTRPAGVDTRGKEGDDTPPIDALPIPKTPPATAVIQCPTPGQNAKEPVGTYLEGFRKKVTGYELIGNECVQLTESVPIPQQIIAGLPSGGQVMQVGSIAVVATASALLAKPLADILLKSVKPTVKKVMKKIATIRKKPIPVLSAGERRAEQRQMNQAVKELRSVFPRRKKKG